MGLPEGSFRYGSTEAETMYAFNGRLWGQATQTREQAEADQPFSTYFRIRNTAPTTNFWDVGFNRAFESSVDAGEVHLGVVYLRSPETAGDATINVFFKQNEGYENHAKRTAEISPGSEWTRYYFPVEYDESSGAGDAWVDFFLGYGEQVIDVGGIAVLRFGNSDVAVSDLPGIWSYQGRSPSAAWRAAAEDRIETHRKADLTVEVLDDGAPVNDATVDVTMTDHEYDFGSVVNAWRMADDSPESQTYREKFREHFNKASIENGLKWDAWENSAHKEATLQTLDWLDANDVPVRGHTLLWPDFASTPDRVDNYSDDPAALHRVIAEHIRDEAGALSGRLTAWDVINEPYTSHEITDILGRESLVDWLEIAAEADPETPRVVNDWGLLYEGADEKREWYADLVTFLQSNGAPLDGLGMQAHFSMHNKTRPSKVVDVIDRFASLGLDVEVTEWDFKIDDPSSESQLALQADYTRDLLKAVFSHPATSSFVGWGFWEGQMYHSSGAYFRDDWSLKPNGRAYLNLVYDEWWTDETGTTSDDGTYETRAFRGEYEITVARGETTKTIEATVSEAGSTVTVDVPTDDRSVSVETGPPSNVTETSATFTGKLTALGDASTVDCRFVYRTTNSDFWLATDEQSIGSTRQFEVTLSHLKSDVEYEYYSVARTSDGEKRTGESLSFRTNATTESASEPVVNDYRVSEAGSPNPHAEITATWDASDDGDLASAEVTLHDAETGAALTSRTQDASGESASGSIRFQRKHARGTTFDVVLTVRDAEGNTVSQTKTVSA